MAGLSDSYLDAMRRFEGYNPRPYWDYRQWTSGYGTRASGPGETIDRPEADRRFRTEVGNARDRVRGFGASMTPGQEAALTSLTYNAGPSWMNSGLGAAVRAGDWNTARQRFLQYVNAGGRPLPGLQQRRQEEAGWLTQADASAAPSAAPFGAPFGGMFPDGSPMMGLGGPRAADEPAQGGALVRQPDGTMGPPPAPPPQPPRQPDPPPSWLVDTLPGALTTAVGADDFQRRVRLNNGLPAPLPLPATAAPPAAAPASPGMPPMDAFMPPLPAAPAAARGVSPSSNSATGGGLVAPWSPSPRPGLPVPTLMQEAGEASVGGMPSGPDLLTQFRPAPPIPPPAQVPPFSEGEMQREPGAFGSPFGPSAMQDPGIGLTAGINQATGGPPQPDADAIVRGAEAAAAGRAPPPARPFSLNDLASNPLFMAGLSILGTAPGGNWGPNGAAAMQAATRGQREQTEFQRLQQQRATMDKAWAEAFPNGQPNAQHPLLQGMPPEMASTIFAMGPEEGLPLAQQWQMLRGRNAEQLRLLQQRADIAEGRQPAQAPPEPPVGSNLIGASGVLPTGGQLESLAASQPSPQPAPTSAPQQAANEPTISFAGETMTLGQAQARARRLDALGMRSELLEKTIADAAQSGRPTEAVRTQSAKVDQAYRSLLPALDSYARLVQQTGPNVFPGQERDSIVAARTNILLQLKELYNLGVLNGPDLTLMEQMLPDPFIGIGWTGPYGLANVGGNASARASAGVDRLKEILRGVRNSQPGLPQVEASAGRGGQSSGDGYRVLGVR